MKLIKIKSKSCEFVYINPEHVSCLRFVDNLTEVKVLPNVSIYIDDRISFVAKKLGYKIKI